LTPVTQHTFEQWDWQTFSSREPTQCRKAMRRGGGGGGFAVLERHAPLVEHPFQIHGGENVVVNSVAVLLLDAGVEEREAGADDHPVAGEPPPVRKGHLPGFDLRGLGTRQTFDTGVGHAAAQLAEHLVRGGERGEEPVPAAQFAPQFRLLLDDQGNCSFGFQAEGRLHARRAAPYDDDSLHYCSLML
jgi:hypothetical protein